MARTCCQVTTHAGICLIIVLGFTTMLITKALGRQQCLKSVNNVVWRQNEPRFSVLDGLFPLISVCLSLSAFLFLFLFFFLFLFLLLVFLSFIFLSWCPLSLPRSPRPPSSSFSSLAILSLSRSFFSCISSSCPLCTCGVSFSLFPSPLFPLHPPLPFLYPALASSLAFIPLCAQHHIALKPFCFLFRLLLVLFLPFFLSANPKAAGHAMLLAPRH